MCPADDRATTLGSVVARLAAAVDHAAELDPALVPATDLGELLDAVQRQANRLDAALLAWTDSFERRNGARATGHRNAQHYLQDRLRLSPTAAKQRVDTARALGSDLHDTRRALERGDITLAQATTIAQAARQAARDRDRFDANDRSDVDPAQDGGDPEAAQGEQRGGAGGGSAPSAAPGNGDGDGTEDTASGEIEQMEQDLLEQAGRHHDGELRKAARRRELVRRPDPEAGARTAYLRRTLSLRHQGDTTWIEGRLHQAAGDALASALADHAQSTGPDDSRDYGQRIADALVHLCTSSRRGGCTRGAGTSPPAWQSERGGEAGPGTHVEGDVTPPSPGTGEAGPTGTEPAGNGPTGPGAGEDGPTADDRRPHAHSSGVAARTTHRTPRSRNGGAGVVAVVPIRLIEEAADLPAGSLAWTGPCPPSGIQDAICRSGLSWLITDATGQPLAYGQTRRYASDAQRAALAIRDGGCRWPGCTSQPRYTIAHHEPPHGRPGWATDLERMALLCGFHHGLRHHGGWKVRLDDDARSRSPRLTARSSARKRPHKHVSAMANRSLMTPPTQGPGPAPPVGLPEPRGVRPRCRRVRPVAHPRRPHLHRARRLPRRPPMTRTPCRPPARTPAVRRQGPARPSPQGRGRSASTSGCTRAPVAKGPVTATRHRPSSRGAGRTRARRGRPPAGAPTRPASTAVATT